MVTPSSSGAVSHDHQEQPIVSRIRTSSSSLGVILITKICLFHCGYYVVIGHVRSSPCLLLTGHHGPMPPPPLPPYRVPPSPHWWSCALNMQISHAPPATRLPRTAARRPLPPDPSAPPHPSCLTTATSCWRRRRRHMLQEFAATICQSPGHHRSPCHRLPPPQVVGAVVSSRSPHLHWFPSLLFICPRSARSSSGCLPPPLRQQVEEAKSATTKINLPQSR
jgi:hypothetical protein